MKTRAIWVSICVLAMCACSENNEPQLVPGGEENGGQENGGQSQVDPADELPGVEIQSIPVNETISFDDEEAAANTALNAFAFDMLNNVVTEAGKDAGSGDGNICISPLSAELCAALMAEAMDGTQGEKTAAAISGASRDVLAGTCNKLIRYLPSEASGASLELGHSIWYQDRYTVTDAFVDRVHDKYYSEVVPVSHGASVVDMVNTWCKLKTHGLIDRLLESNQSCDVLFANALYFKAEWEFAFREKSTEQRTFKGRDNRLEVDMMRRSNPEMYAAGERAEAVQLPFKGELAMTLLLPAEGLTADQLASTLSIEEWESFVFDYENVSLWVPKFEVSQSYDLTGALSSLGLPTRFNLAGMGIGIKGDAAILQKTCFKLNEKGAEGAAATVGIWSSSNGNDSKPEYIDVHFDRPFVYVIHSTKTGTILMSGVVNNI